MKYIARCVDGKCLWAFEGDDPSAAYEAKRAHFKEMRHDVVVHNQLVFGRPRGADK